MKSILRNSLTWLAVVALVTIGSLLVAQDVDPVTQKTILLSEALKAREDGNLSVAREGFLKILKIDKSDEGAKEGLASVDAAIAASAAKNAQAAAPASSLLEAVANNQKALFREVPQAIAAANDAADQGNFAGALKILDGASAALPNNTAAQPLRDEVELTRQEILTRRESGDKGADHLAREEFDRLAKANSARIDAAEDLVDEAEKLIRKEEFDKASANLDKAKAILPLNIATDSLVQRIEEVRFTLLARRAIALIDAREMSKADACIREYEEKSKKANGQNESTAQRLRAEYESKKMDPLNQNLDDMSPGLRAKDARIEELLVKGRARYLYGDYMGALDVYREVLQYSPNNSEAKAFQVRIRQAISENSGQWNRGVTKSKLLELVDESWKLPEVYSGDSGKKSGQVEEGPVIAKLRSIVIPEVNFRDLPFDRVIQQLGTMAKSYDKDNVGINMDVIDQEKKNPTISMSLLSPMSLDRILDLLVKKSNFSYEINKDMIIFTPDVGASDMETEFFNLSPSAETKMTGLNSTPVAATSVGAPSPGVASGDGMPRGEAIKNFLIRSGVTFDEKAQINYDGTTLIVTQTRKNLDRIRNVLRRYSDIKQVHIEAKFIEISESSLNEFSTNLRLNNSVTGNLRAQTNLRDLNTVFGTNTTSSYVDITFNGSPLAPTPVTSPVITGSANYGGTAANFGGTSGVESKIGTIGSYDLSIFLKAIEQNAGADVMSAPSLTVLDGKTATIRIAQLLRYPQSYQSVTPQVSPASNTGGGSVAIAAGTPQDFTTENVGVTLEVTPTVGAEDSTINLNLKPAVTEFEGFVDYGATSVALTDTATVSVPSGFFQPIFNKREVVTDVTVYDGATVVIGGLSREEVKTTNDKVPVLGDIPIIGNAFRSSGKSTVKKNLMVFVTANLVSPGGAPLKSNFQNLRAGSTFQNPIITSPGGAVYREPVEATGAPSSK